MKIFEAASSSVVLTITDMGFLYLPSDMGVKAAPPDDWNWIAPSSSKPRIVQGREKKIEQKTFLDDSDYPASLERVGRYRNVSYQFRVLYRA
jgi:hypothetical protein